MGCFLQALRLDASLQLRDRTRLQSVWGFFSLIPVIILSCKRAEMLGCSNSPSSVRRAEPDPFMGVSLLLQPSPHSKGYDFFFEVGAGLMSFE